MKSLFNFQIILIVLVFISFTSCSKSKEDIVKKEFKQYVQQNFDDPRTLKEMVSVSIIDTISKDKIKKIKDLLFEQFKLTENVDSIYNHQYKELNDKIIKIHSKVNSNDRNTIVKLLEEGLRLAYEHHSWIEEYGVHKESLESELDSAFNNLDNLNMYEYEIKVRIEKNNSLSMKSYYALEDSLQIRFFDHKPAFEDYSESAYNFYKVGKQYEEFISTRSDIQSREMDNLKKLHLVASHY